MLFNQLCKKTCNVQLVIFKCKVIHTASYLSCCHQTFIEFLITMYSCSASRIINFVNLSCGLVTAKTTPNGCLVSGPLPASNYNNCKFSRHCTCAVMLFSITHAYLYSIGLFLRILLVSLMLPDLAYID